MSGADASGELVFSGCTNASAEGRAGKPEDERFPNQSLPVCLKALSGVPVRLVASGAAACHTLAVGADGALWAWGRNECGQLGLGDLAARYAPCKVPGLPSGAKASAAACGKHHSLVALHGSGEVYAMGSNAMGQLGLGSVDKKDPLVRSVTKTALTPPAKAVACGAEFSLALTAEGGAVYSWGSPQHGQLGNGTTGEHNTKESSIKLGYTPYPLPVRVTAGGLGAKTATGIAAGISHCLCSDSEGALYTWGCGDYGRLGHSVQKDELVPRRVETFSGRLALPASATAPVMAAGGSHSFVVGVGGMAFMWGKVKQSGDCWMYPKPLDDLAGWGVRAAALGATSAAVGADDSTITWGQAQYGELGYGPKKKSSANPARVDTLTGLTAISVACGVGHIAVVLKEGAPKGTQVFDAPETAPDLDKGEDAADAKGPGGKGGKRKPEPKKGPKAAAKKPKKK